MNSKKTYAERLKKMKESIEKNKDLLDQEFPDDVTTTGSADLIRHKDTDKNSTEENPDE